MVLLRSPEGPAGRVCGDRAGYSTLTRVEAGQEVGLAAVLQSPGYRWSIRLTQLACQPVAVPRLPECGLVDSVATARLLHNTRVRKKVKKKVGRVGRAAAPVCDSREPLGLQDLCGLTRQLRSALPWPAHRTNILAGPSPPSYLSWTGRSSPLKSTARASPPAPPSASPASASSGPLPRCSMERRRRWEAFRGWLHFSTR